MEKRSVFATCGAAMIAIGLSSVTTAAPHAHGLEPEGGARRTPHVVEGAMNSLVRDVEAMVIIPGESHEDLWVHPNLVTIPGDPVRIELALRATDRRGGEWPRDGQKPNGDTWLARIRWRQPNEQMTPDGRERLAVPGSGPGSR